MSVLQSGFQSGNILGLLHVYFKPGDTARHSAPRYRCFCAGERSSTLGSVGLTRRALVRSDSQHHPAGLCGKQGVVEFGPDPRGPTWQTRCFLFPYSYCTNRASIPSPLAAFLPRGRRCMDGEEEKEDTVPSH